METNGINFTRFLYQLDDKKETVSKYFLYNTEPYQNQYLFTEWIQIEKDFRKNNCSNINYWIRKKDAPTWQNSNLVTGLRETNLKGIYYADEVNNKGVKSLLLVQICNDIDIIVIDYFKNFYPYTLAKRLDFINKHQFEFKPFEKV